MDRLHLSKVPSPHEVNLNLPNENGGNAEEI